MSQQSLATWGNSLKVAGTSDARQIRQILDGINLLAYDRFAFCSLLGGEEYQNNNGVYTKKSVSGKIASKGVKTLSPELYDFEAAPNALRLTSDTSALAVGDSSTFNFETTNGVSVGSVINNVNQGATIRVTSITSSTALVATVIAIHDASPSITFVADANVAYFEKLASANADGATVGNGTNQEPINRSNYLQFMIEPLAQGILQKNLALYATGGNTEFANEKKRKMLDMQRNRESTFIAGRKTSTGSGTSRILTSNGLLGMAASAFNNTNVDGSLSYDEFARGVMPAARQGGGAMEVYGICGNDVLTTLSGYSQTQLRMKQGEDKYGSVIQVLETPSGVLNLIPSAFMDTDARRGQMITFQPSLLTRTYLEGLDIQYMENLNIGNELVDRGAIVGCEALMASNTKAITLFTNILK